MSNRIVIPHIAIARRFLNAAGNEVITPAINPGQAEIEGSTIWFSAVMTPTALASSIQPFAFTSVGGEVAIDGNFGVFTAIASGAGYLLFSADKVPDATTNLVDNTVLVFFGPRLAARLGVSAALQKGGLQLLHTGGAAIADNRYQLSAANTNLSAGTLPTATKVYSKTSGNHGLETGDRVILATLTGGTGLTATATYFFHKLSPATGYLCSTYANALAGTAVNSTTDATNVVLTIPGDVGIVMTSVDPALRIFIEGGFTD